MSGNLGEMGMRERGWEGVCMCVCVREREKERERERERERETVYSVTERASARKREKNARMCVRELALAD